MADVPLPSDLQNELDEALFSLDELMSESPEEALSMFQTLPETVRQRPEFQLTRARALQESGLLNEARTVAESLLKDDGEQELLADVHHLLGDVLEDLGESEAANAHFIRTLRIDEVLFAERRHLEGTELESILEASMTRALDDLEPSIRRRITSHRIELFPTVEDVSAGLDPRAFSTYVAEDSSGMLRIFAANLDAEYGDLHELGEFDEHVLAELRLQLDEHLQLG